MTFALHELCKKNELDQIAKIQHCIEEGVNINELDDQGHTALFYAVQDKNVESVTYLVQCAADPNIAGKSTFPPLVITAAFNDLDCALALLKHPRIDINQRQLKNCTALYAAAQQGYTEIVNLLLNSGADPAICVSDNLMSPLHIAVVNDRPDIVSVLCQKAPQLINVGNSNGWAPLHFAAAKNVPVVLEVLIENGAELNITNNSEQTPLYIAIDKRAASNVKTLLAAGANHRISVKERGKKVLMLAKAGCMMQRELVELLLNYPHPHKVLSESLHDVMQSYYSSPKVASRQKLYQISERIVQAINKLPPPKKLCATDSKPLTWNEAYIQLFLDSPTVNDTNPTNKEALLRQALASILELLSDPLSCQPYLMFLSTQLEQYWQQTYRTDFPDFDQEMVDFWEHEGKVWPAPNENYKNFKRNQILDRIIMDKFRQHKMGAKASKWTGFVPQETSSPLLSNNAFFTENRKTINGLLHGNIHNIQRFIVLCAMEAGKIPLSYSAGDTTIEITPKEVFSALHRTDLWSYKIPHPPLWIRVLDWAEKEFTTFSHPQHFQSILLTDNQFKGTLQNYLRFSFCNEFIKLRLLLNHVYSLQLTNQTLIHELKKIDSQSFGILPEFAIQLDEKQCLEEVSKIDSLEGDGRNWKIQEKHFELLETPVARFSL